MTWVFYAFLSTRVFSDASGRAFSVSLDARESQDANVFLPAFSCTDYLYEFIRRLSVFSFVFKFKFRLFRLSLRQLSIICVNKTSCRKREVKCVQNYREKRIDAIQRVEGTLKQRPTSIKRHKNAAFFFSVRIVLSVLKPVILNYNFSKFLYTSVMLRPFYI